MKVNVESLREAGLTDGEISVYLALLEIGASTSGPIVDKSGVSRSIVYQILERLVEKGLASFIVKEKTRYYQAGNPEKILNYIDERKKKIEENRKKVEDMLPVLLEKQKSGEKSEATIYLGFKGIRSAHENIYSKLGKGDCVYYLGVPAYQPEEQHLYWQKDHLKRIKAGIGLRSLFNRDADPKILKNRNKFKGCEARYMPFELKTPATFGIYADTVVIVLQAPSVIAVEIVNQDIADSFKAYFDEFWGRSEKFKSR
jgi:HTH-type transcriptional regulator, sugar sensing transcriptional regulator